MVVQGSRGQVFNPGELPLVLLALAERGDRSAYDFIAELKRMVPNYQPSPGGIYPALHALVAEGLLDVHADGRARTYRITEAGGDAVDRRRDKLANVEHRIGARFTAAGSLDAVLSRFAARVRPLSGLVDPTAAAAVLDRAAEEIENLRGVRRART